MSSEIKEDRSKSRISSRQKKIANSSDDDVSSIEITEKSKDEI